MKKGISVLLVLLLLITVTFRLIRFYEAKSHQAEREKLEQVYEEAVKGKGNANQADQEKVIGKIRIPALDIDYIILNKTTDENLDISISKVIGPPIHHKGNLVLAGHNMNNGSFFGRLKRIKSSDKIILENKSGIQENYYMIDTYIVDKTDLSPLSQKNQADHLLTLITCTENSDKRLVVVAAGG